MALGFERVLTSGGAPNALAGALMIADPANITEEAIDLQLANVRRSRFDERHFSLGDKMPPALKRIPSPVQMIWGERDVLPYPNARARADAARAARPDARIEVVPDAGHWVQFEAPETVNRSMLEFFESQVLPGP